MNTLSLLTSLQQRLRDQGELSLLLKIRCGAAKTRFVAQLANEAIKIDVAAVPEDGKANRELITLLTKSFGVKKDQVEILIGKTSSMKRVKVTL